MKPYPPIHVICPKCHKSIKMGPFDKSGKRHGHCHLDGLEFHYHEDTGVYSHPYATNKFKAKQEFGMALREYRAWKLAVKDEGET